MSKREKRLKAVSRLDQVEIIHEEPCSVRWDEMYGDDIVRSCSYCHLNVYNFAGMTPEAICQTINLHEGKLCAAFYARADGTMTLKPCAQEKKAFLRGRIVIRPQP